MRACSLCLSRAPHGEAPHNREGPAQDTLERGLPHARQAGGGGLAYEAGQPRPDPPPPTMGAPYLQTTSQRLNAGLPHMPTPPL